VPSRLNYLLADARVQEMKQRAYEDAYRRAGVPRGPGRTRRLLARLRRASAAPANARLHRPVTLRPAAAADHQRLAFLAALDSAPPLALPALLAEVDDELRAAVSLVDRRVIAHPFHLAETNVALLLLAAERSGPGTPP
jgi:hypothetical protein